MNRAAYRVLFCVVACITLLLTCVDVVLHRLPSRILLMTLSFPGALSQELRRRYHHHSTKQHQHLHAAPMLMICTLLYCPNLLALPAVLLSIFISRFISELSICPGAVKSHPALSFSTSHTLINIGAQ